MAEKLLHEQGLTRYFRHSKQFYYIITDIKGQLLYANPLFGIRTGFTSGIIPTFSIGDFIEKGDIQKCFSAIEKCLEQSDYFVMDPLCLRQRADNSTICWELSVLRNERDEPEAIQWMGIEQQVAPKENLLQDGAYYRNIIADVLDAAVLTDEKGIITYASQPVNKILGYQPEEIIGKSAFDFLHPDDREHSMSAFFKEIELSPKARFIYSRVKKKSGEWLWCMVRGHNLLSNPYMGSVLINFFDDTPRRNAEMALIESERRLRSQAIILTNVYDLIATTDLGLNITSWNRVAEEISGIPATEAIGAFFPDIIEIEYSTNTAMEVAEMVFSKGIWHGEISFVNRSGERKYFLKTISILRDEKGIAFGLLGVGKCITERKKIEKKLQESEFFYRNLIAHSLDGIVMTDPLGQITYCGPSVTKMSGYEAGQLLGHNLFEFVHPDDLKAAREAFALEINKQSISSYILLRLRHSDGNWRWCSVRGHNLLRSSGISSMVIYFTEETKRKEIEDRLRESEQRFRHLIQNLNLGVLLMNESGVVLICNKFAVDILGITEKEFIGMPVLDIDWDAIHEDGSKFIPYDYPVAVAIRTKKSARNVVMGVHQVGNPDRVWILVNAEVVMDDEDKILYAICSYTDITEQRRLSRQLIEQEIQKQKQLIQATIDGQEKERKEIGRELHDNISQHLTTTRLYLEVAKEKSEGEQLRMINLAHKGLLDIVSEIRQLSQSLVPPSLSDIGLVESVNDLCLPLIHTHAFNIDFTYHQFNEALLQENMKLMLFRIIQEQVNNIVRHSGADSIQINLRTSEGRVILTVADNGKGFDSGSIKKGLGFNSISSRADLFGGRLRIDAAPGKGCMIQVIIPMQQ